MAEVGKPEELVKRLKYTLECSICMDTYTDPRILDCVHSFCFKCIHTHVGNSPVIKCPLCNKQSPLPIYTGVEGLKSNFFIKGLIDDMMHTEEKNVESVPAVERTSCGSCDLGNMAKSHCDDCDCELCDRCIQLHSQLKIFKPHKFTLYPTDEKIKHVKAQKEAVVNKHVTDIPNNIAADISNLKVKMSQVQAKLQAVNNERDTTITQVNAAYQRFLLQIESYVQGLTTRIKQQAEKTGSAYETQLTTLQTLEKQHICIQIKKSTSAQACQFVSENTKLKMEPLLEQAIGFLTPIAIKNRFERKVDIRAQFMSDNMVDYAVECAHEALDEYGKYQSTTDRLNLISKSINDRYAHRFYRGNWSCCVIKGSSGFDLCWKNLLSFSIDGYDIILMGDDDTFPPDVSPSTDLYTYP